MHNNSSISSNAGGLAQTIEAGFRTPSSQRTSRPEPVSRDTLDVWDLPRQPQNSPRTPAQLPQPQHPSSRESQIVPSIALEFLHQFKTTLLPLSPNRRVATLVNNREALHAMAATLPNEVDGAQMRVELGLTTLVASVSCDTLSTFESLCDRHKSDLLTVARSDFAWLVRVAASKGGDFVHALLSRLPVSQWHALLAEDDGSGFKSLLRHKDSKLLTTMFTATPDEQVKALLERSSHAVGEAMHDESMARALGPVLSRVGIHLS